LKTEVFDNSKKVVGFVSRVFGPVDSPYISVRPPKDYKPSLELMGKDVYVQKKKG
jgi:rRNA processing protein Gar1